MGFACVWRAVVLLTLEYGVLLCVVQPSLECENKTKNLTFIYLLDVGEIYSRLLDHRPVIQGEIRYFIKEFEVSIFIISGEKVFGV